MALSLIKLTNSTSAPLQELLEEIKRQPAPSNGMTPSITVKSQGKTPIFQHLQVSDKELGKGSTGTVYHAWFKVEPWTYAPTGKQGATERRECAVKFPNTLFQQSDTHKSITIKDGRIQVKTGKKDGSHKKKPQAGSLTYRDAVQDLRKEFENGFTLRFGRRMYSTHIADKGEPTQVTVELLRETLLAEADSLHSQWGYQNIHPVWAFDETIPCLVSEFFETSVHDWASNEFKAHGQSMMHAWNTIVGPILKQVVAGLHYMHESVRMAHMDIKPSNMLCRPATQAGFVCVLCDFGGCMDADTPSSECTGTIGYMAPEVERLEGKSAGTDKYVPRYTDAFSLGAAFLHMLHPDVPYDTEQAQRLMLDKLREKGQSEAQKPEGQLFLTLIAPTTPPPQRYAQFKALAQSMMQPIGMYATSLPTMA